MEGNNSNLLAYVNEQHAPRQFGDYDSVQVFIAYWQESANDGYQQEAAATHAFFETRLGYPTETYAIPNARS